jgi:hypothetical protein
LSSVFSSLPAKLGGSAFQIVALVLNLNSGDLEDQYGKTDRVGRALFPK